jgi:hypothetical protein
VVGAAIIISPGASHLLPYNCCSIPFKSAPALLLHLFLPTQEAKLLACASLAIFSYCPSELRGSFTMSLLYLATVHGYCPSGFRGSFILPLHYTSLNPVPNAQVCVHLTIHITKLQLQTTFPKPLYIRHSACIYWDPGR